MSRLCTVAFVCLLVVLRGGDARAQQPPAATPAPDQKPPEAPKAFTGSATVGVSVESGQTDLTGVQLAFQGQHPYSKNGTLTMGANYQYATTDTPDTAETIKVADHIDGQVGIEHTYRERWVLMARTEALRDTIQQIDYRLNEIIGLGPKWHKGRLQFRFIPGVALLTHDKNVAAENGFNFNYGFYQDAVVAVSPGWTFNQSLYTSHDVSDDHDYFLSFNAQLTGAITKRFGLQFSYLNSYESLLPVGVDPRHQKTMVGLQINF